MRIVLTGDDALRLEPVAGPLTIEAPETGAQYSPFHMLASSLAVCTYSVLASWGSQTDIAADDLSISVSWRFAEQPHRVGAIKMLLTWPSLPAERVQVARRAALLCPIHATLSSSPAIEIAAGS